MAARPRGLLVLALLGAALGCGRIYEYPDAEQEADARACADGTDNDVDDQVDCQDPDCSGFCPEQSLPDCTDLRDNDGDGLADVSDPACWTFSPPVARRCASAKGVEIVESFDVLSFDFGAAIWGAWQAYGVGTADVDLGSIREGDRFEIVQASESSVLFVSNASGAEELDTNLGALVRQRVFAGRWQGFELGLTAGVWPGARLRAGIVPSDFAPSQEAPLAGAERRLVSVDIDRSRSPATFTLSVDGEAFSAELPEISCGDTVDRGFMDVADCDSAFLDVTVSGDASGLKASAVLDDGVKLEVYAPLPSAPTLPISRLVFWGGSTTVRRGAVLSRADLHVNPSWPCGFEDPQIRPSTCDAGSSDQALGHTVAVARAEGGEFCALVTSSADPVEAPARSSAWQSPDGRNWSLAGQGPAPFEPSSGSLELVGAGIAADSGAWHAVVAARGPGGVELSFADAEQCGAWNAMEPGPELPADAEAPSYVIAADQHLVYFTRPSNAAVGRSLWRVRRSQDAGPELLAELPRDVGQPVSVTRVGSRDLVLTYPTAPGSGASGVGLLTGSLDANRWQHVEPSPLLALPPALVSHEGQVAFDDRGLVAVALSFENDHGFLLYSGLSGAGWTRLGFTPELTVGVATLTRAGDLDSASEVVPADRCGDGSCAAGESCTTCEFDCPCAGKELLSDVFAPDVPWQFGSSAENPELVQFVDGDAQRLEWTGGPSTWSTLPLTRPLDGDFELSFDLISADADYDGSDAACSLYFGLGAESDFLSEPSAGIFAELALARWCPARYWVQPYVLTGAGRRFETEGHSDQFFCPGDALVVPDEWRNFVLRRRENVVSVSTSVLGQCAPAEQSLMYAGAMPALSSLRFGFGGNGFGVCPEGVGAGTIRNVELRLPDDPAECPEGRMLCTVDDAEPSCIDLRSSSEHCGACGRACASEESCVNGRCACSDASGFLVCDGACVDSSSSREHCGSCERSCEERCVNGRCDLLGTCASPLELAAAGGSFSLVFTGDPELSLAYCDPNAQSYWAVDFSVLRWTPDTTGTAIIEVGGDPELVTLLTITSVPDAACSYWATCGYVKRLDAFVSAGTPYLLGIGANPNGTFGRAEVRIRVAP